MMEDAKLISDMPAACSEEIFGACFEDSMQGFRRVMALKAAVELSLFSKTRDWTTPGDVASSEGWDEIMVSMLMDCMTDMGLLECDSGGFRNTTAASLYLDPRSERYQGTFLWNTASRMRMWFDLGETVRNGPSPRDAEMADSEIWIRSIAESAMGGGIARTLDIVDGIMDGPLSGTFLDLGGGHGLYTVAFCHRHPGLRAYLFDKPEMMPVARETFERYGCSAEVIPGDFYRDSLGGPYDIVFSSFNRSTSDSSLCERVFESVKTGGLLIMRRHLDPGPPSPLAVLEWNMILYDDAEKGKKRFHGSWMPTSEEYLDVIKGMGMELLARQRADRNSEVVILRKIR